MQASPLPRQDLPVAAVRPAIQWLVAATCVAVVVALVGAVLRETASLSKPGAMETLAYANGDSAHITFTNPGSDTLFQCVRGVVKNKQGSTAGPGGTTWTKTVTVCTGDVKPHSTVALEAPFPVGTVRDLCSAPAENAAARQLDWGLCTFDIEPVGARGGGTP
jgi:hypothetical protein